MDTKLMEQYELQLFPPSGLLKIIAIEISGPLPRRKSGNRHAVIITDRWDELTPTVPTKNVSSTHVAYISYNRWAIPYGITDVILSHNSSNLSEKFSFHFATTLELKTRPLHIFRSQADKCKSVALKREACIATFSVCRRISTKVGHILPAVAGCFFHGAYGTITWPNNKLKYSCTASRHFNCNNSKAFEGTFFGRTGHNITQGVQKVPQKSGSVWKNFGWKI